MKDALLILLLLLLIIISTSKIKVNNNFRALFGDTYVIRGLFCLFIVFSHICQNIEYSSLYDILFYLGIISNGIFFFLSGYGTMSKIRKNKNYVKGFLKNKLFKILLPLLIISLVYMLYYYVFENTLISLPDIIRSIASGMPLVLFSWYVIVLLLYYVEIYILAKLLKNNYNAILLSMLIIHIFFAIACLRSNFGYWWYTTSHLLIIGSFYSLYESRIISIIKSKYCVIFCLMLFIFLSSLLISSYKSFNNTISITLVILNSILLVSVLVLFMHKYILSNKLLSFIGKISYYLYLIHGLLILGLRSRIIFIENDSLYIILVLLFSMLLSYLFHIIINKLIINVKYK